MKDEILNQCKGALDMIFYNDNMYTLGFNGETLELYLPFIYDDKSFITFDINNANIENYNNNIISKEHFVDIITHTLIRELRNEIKKLSDEYANKCIPKGCYCYDENGYCPFKTREIIQTENGVVSIPHCLYLGESDLHCTDEEFEMLLKHFNCDEDTIWDKYPLDLLWDSCKCCDMNDNYRELYS